MHLMDKLISLPKYFLVVVAALLAFTANAASAIEKPLQGANLLLDTYHRNLAKLEKNNFGFPLIVESSEQDDRVHVDVYGIFLHPFSSIVNVLKVPANWCDIVSLFPNVKASTYSVQPGNDQLTFYLGKKIYQPPEDARQIIFNFRNADLQQGYLDIILNAHKGPYGTRDHRIRVEALPIDGGRTFIHVSYAYSDSAALRLLAKIYFATLGRSKVGFTVTGTDENGNPVYIGGPRGAVERTAVRCYFALQSFMNTLHYPEESRFSMRISQWYDLTAHWKQLFDLDKQDYLTEKTAEHKNQLTLQQQIGTEHR
jgi:hypothetical protein